MKLRGVQICILLRKFGLIRWEWIYFIGRNWLILDIWWIGLQLHCVFELEFCVNLCCCGGFVLYAFEVECCVNLYCGGWIVFVLCICGRVLWKSVFFWVDLYLWCIWGWVLCASVFWWMDLFCVFEVGCCANLYSGGWKRWKSAGNFAHPAITHQKGHFVRASVPPSKLHFYSKGKQTIAANKHETMCKYTKTKYGKRHKGPNGL